MRFRLLAAIAAVFSLVVVTRAAQPAAGRSRQAAASVLPPGTGRDVVARLCADCHALSTVVSRRRLASEWRETLDKMYTQGLSATDDEDAKILAYFSDQLGRVDLNKGSVKELRAVLDITKEQADAVIAARPFASAADLAKVEGLDEKKVAGLRERIVVTPIKTAIKKF